MSTVHTAKVTFRDGTEIDTFDEITVTHDMLASSSAWTLSLWYSQRANTTWDVLQRKAQLGATLTFALDDCVQMQALIEDVNEVESRLGGETMVLSGRDTTCLAEYDADPRTQLRHTTLEDALAAILQPTGLLVNIVDAAAAQEIRGIARRRRSNSARAQRRQAVDRFRIKPGEKMWETTVRICAQMGLLVWTAPMLDDQGQDSGAMWVTVDTPVESGPPTFRFNRIDNGDGTFSGNINEGSHRRTIRGIPTQVLGFGHTAMADGDDARIAIPVNNDILLDSTQNDGLVVPDMQPQWRFLTREHSRTQDMIEREGQREIAMANRNFRVYECTVQGWNQLVGGVPRLYGVNTVAHVRDDRRRIDKDMLVTAVTFRRSRQGATTATVRMVPLGVVKVFPEPQ